MENLQIQGNPHPHSEVFTSLKFVFNSVLHWFTNYRHIQEAPLLNITRLLLTEKTGYFFGTVALFGVDFFMRTPELVDDYRHVQPLRLLL
jgi:hypothetical protein